MRINAQRARSKPMKAGTTKPKRSDLERQPWDCLPALMMAGERKEKKHDY